GKAGAGWDGAGGTSGRLRSAGGSRRVRRPRSGSAAVVDEDGRRSIRLGQDLPGARGVVDRDANRRQLVHLDRPNGEFPQELLLVAILGPAHVTDREVDVAFLVDRVVAASY